MSCGYLQHPPLKFGKGFGISNLAFPYGNYFPPEASKLSFVLLIAVLIADNLVAPESPARLRPHRVRASMVMPEAAVYQYDGVKALYYDIRLTRQFFVVKSVPHTQSIQEFPDDKFGARVLPFNRGHISTARFGNRVITHLS
jgi:hypothetical protein